MSDPVRSRSTAQALILLLCGTALVVIGVAGLVTARLRPLAGAGFALIGVGFAWNGVRWFRGSGVKPE